MNKSMAAWVLAAAAGFAAGCGPDTAVDPVSQSSTPRAVAAAVEFTLERTTCLGACPAYRVTVRGDGSGEYEGRDYVDVRGRHAFAVPPDEVAALVAQARRDDLWSMRGSYEAQVTDGPSYLLTLREGRTTHRISDYLGGFVGMPKAVTEMEEAVDRVARSRQWVVLSSEAVGRLEAEGFDFTSRAAGEMLARAVANPEGDDDAAMARLIELGAPLLAPKRDDRDADTPQANAGAEALLHAALEQGRPAVVDAILARAPWLLEHESRQAAVDAIWAIALRGGSLAAIERAWALDPKVRPSAMVWVKPEFGKAQRIPACLQLNRAKPAAKSWDGVAIMRWLEAHDCDVVRGRGLHGETFLHLAAELGDIELTRWLLARGADPNALGAYNYTALGNAETEDVAMALIEAGARYHRDGGGADFRRAATELRWSRVLAWLDAHPGALRAK
jgi:hypothetical protein